MERILSRRAFLQLAAGTMASIVLAACAPQPTAAPTQPPAEPKPTDKPAEAKPADKPLVTVTYWPPPWVAGEEEPKVGELFNTKYKESKKIECQITIFPPDQFQQKVEAGLTAGNSADIIFTSPIELYTRVKRGWFVSLQGYIDRDIKMEDYFPQTLNYLKFPETGAGEFYGMPRDWVVATITYNKDLFDKAGVSYPSPDWTFDDLRDAAKKLTKTEGNTTVYGFNPFGRTPWRTKLWGDGGRKLADDRSECYFDSDISIAAAQFFTDMLLKDKSIPTSGAFPKGINPFAAGLIAMEIPWCCNQTVGSEIGDKFKWDVEVVPKGSKGRVTYGGPDGISMASTCQHRDETWEVMKFVCTDPETSFFFANRPGFLPFSRAIWDSPEIKNAFNCPSYERVMMASADVLKSEYSMGFQEWGDALASAFEAIMLEKLTVPEAMKEAKQKGDKILAEWYKA